jgi:hypothetical protein
MDGAMDIDEYRTAYFHVTMRRKLGGAARDPTPADVEAVLAEGLNGRLGIDRLMDLEVTKVPAPA